jgi:type IV pilus assembly protein PilC
MEPTFMQKMDLALDRFRGVSAQSKLFFIQHLGVMVRASLSLHDALVTLAEEMENPFFRRVITAIASSVDRGDALAASMARFPRVFSDMFVNMVRAGEKSGKLDEVLRELHLELAKDHTLRSKIRGALLYPSVIVVVMIGIFIFMMTVVLPRLISIFDTINVELPLATRIVIGISRFSSDHGILVAVTVLGSIALTVFFGRRPTGKAFIHRLMLHAPVMGTLVRKINCARFTRTLSSLLKTDIPFSQALTITGKVLGNVHYQAAVARFAESVKQGTTLEALLRSEPKLFPPLVRQMTSVGEKTGTLDAILSTVADFYEEDIANTMDHLPALIEPILIVVLGVGVGGLAVAIIMPMYSLAQNF